MLAVCSSAAVFAQAPRPSFEVATVKLSAPGDPNSGSWSIPDKGVFWAKHLSLPYLMQLAFGVSARQIAGKPGWFDDVFYDIEAKPEAGVKLSRDELKPRLQALLSERLHLVVHTEERPVHGYMLEIAKGGSLLKPAGKDHFEDFSADTSPGQMRGFNWSMPVFVRYLTNATGFPVVDRTGLTGRYDVAFSYALESDQESTLPTLPAALKQATGLLLKPGTVPAPFIVIDSVDKTPTDN